MERNPDHSDFWDIADDFIMTGKVEEGTMMGHHCLRSTSGGGFVATVERETGNMVVKLSKDTVAELVESGEGLSFAPAGKVFREWVAIPNKKRWAELVEASIDFVT